MLAFIKANEDALKLLASVAGGLAVSIAGSFALYRWNIDQRWRRVQFSFLLIQTFFGKENTKLALRLVDTFGYMELPSASTKGEQLNIVLTEDMVFEALFTLDQQQEFTEPQFTIRLILDEFFTDLSMFQHHIDAGLIKIEDIRPYLEYWIKAINGHGKIFTIKLAHQANAFLRSFDYIPVIKLSEAMGYQPKSE